MRLIIRTALAKRSCRGRSAHAALLRVAYLAVRGRGSTSRPHSQHGSSRAALLPQEKLWHYYGPEQIAVASCTAAEMDLHIAAKKDELALVEEQLVDARRQADEVTQPLTR
ncbi:hypothetical protein R1sor_002335 [Riccia sorocarpa]|uniref:Uncharacterized protein n=1 Tax=Riccia sorocarpa TaxID=122646 RepID=A0ABD3GYW9_9MARC